MKWKESINKFNYNQPSITKIIHLTIKHIRNLK